MLRVMLPPVNPGAAGCTAGCAAGPWNRARRSAAVP